MIKDNGTWHKKMRAEAFRDPEILAEYEEFKLEFELAEQLKSARKQRHFSQQMIADKMHSSKSAVSRLEAAGGSKNHSPSLSSLSRYAQALGCHLEIKLVPNLGI